VLTEKDIQERKVKNHRNLSRTTPEQAAEIIVTGIKARRPRILIGSDARLLSLIGRFFPRRYFSIINFISGGRLKNVK
jgi:hypothetical protein